MGILKRQSILYLGTNSDRATNDVRNAIAQIRQDLPQDINDPIVERLEFFGVPVDHLRSSDFSHHLKKPTKNLTPFPTL